jgi:hypothetical protein
VSFVALHRSEETLALLERYPNAFLLLAQIALRARWTDCPVTGLKAGQAFIGDWRKAGLKSPKAYEVAKKRLEKCGLVGFRGGNKGTVATILDTRIFSVSNESGGSQGGSQGEPKGEPRGTNNKDTRKPSKERESAGASGDDLSEKAQTIVAAYPRKEKVANAIAIVHGHLRGGESYEAMLSGTKAAAAIIRTLPSGASNRYVPGAENFFLSKRWADDPETLRRQGDTKSGSKPMSDEEADALLGGRAPQRTDEAARKPSIEDLMGERSLSIIKATDLKE